MSALGIEDREGNPGRIADTAGNSEEELTELNVKVEALFRVGPRSNANGPSHPSFVKHG